MRYGIHLCSSIVVSSPSKKSEGNHTTSVVLRLLGQARGVLRAGERMEMLGTGGRDTYQLCRVAYTIDCFIASKVRYTALHWRPHGHHMHLLDVDSPVPSIGKLYHRSFNAEFTTPLIIALQ